MKTCVTCELEEPDIEFNWRWKGLGIKQKSSVIASTDTRGPSIGITW
jgi:hypothetical protein